MPGHIRSAAKKRVDAVFLGPGRPEYLDEPMMTLEDREAAIGDLAKLRESFNQAKGR